MRTLNTILAVTVSILVATQISRFAFTYWCFISDTNADWIHNRIDESISALPKIFAQPEPLHIMMGSSETETSFRPLSFDQEMSKLNHPMLSYNFGFRGINPTSLFSIVMRMREETQRAGRKIDLVTVVFQPIHMTTKSMASDFNWRNGWVQVAATSPRQLFRTAKRYPGLGLHLAIAKYLFGGLPAESTLTAIKGSLLFPRSPVMAPFHDLWGSRRLSFEPAWDFDQRGYYRWGFPTHPDAEEALKQVEMNHRLQHEIYNYYLQRYDVWDLKLDRHMLRRFIFTIEALQKIAKKVCIVSIPFSPQFRISQKGRMHWQKALRLINRRTGAKIIHLKDEFLRDDYLDFVHFSEAGEAKYNEALAKRLASALEEQEE